MRSVRVVNKWLYDEAPWKLKGEGEALKRASIIRGALEAVFVCAHLLEPLLPNACRIICIDQLSTPMVTLRELKESFDNLEPGREVCKMGVLFEKVRLEEDTDLPSVAKVQGKGKKCAGGGKEAIDIPTIVS